MPRYGNNIYKRKDGRFEGRYIKTYIDGKAKYGYVYAASYNEVKNKLAIKKAMLETIIDNGETIGKFLISWLSQTEPDIKESTYMLYRNIINKHLISDIGEIKLYELTTEHVNRFVKSKGDLAVKTIYSIFGVLNTALSYAEVEKMIPVNPCKAVKLPKLIPKSIQVFTYNQQKLLESVCDIGVMICLYTGLRIGELCALKWSNINFHNETLQVRETVQRIKNIEKGAKTKIINTSPKTHFSERNIPIPKFLIDKLLPLRGEPNDYIISVKGKQMEPRTYQYRFRKMLEKQDLPLLSFHSLRHTFSTRALELGFDIKTLSEILGHHNANITLKTYAHSIMEHKRKQMNLFGKLQE